MKSSIRQGVSTRTRARTAPVLLSVLLVCLGACAEEAASGNERTANNPVQTPMVGTNNTMMTAPAPTMMTAPTDTTMTTAPTPPAMMTAPAPMSTAPMTGTAAMGGQQQPPTAGTGTAGTMAMAGAGGTGATAGTGAQAGGPDATCLAGFEASGSTASMECRNCLCQPDNCVAELMAIDGDAAATAVVECGREAGCSGTCCLCGESCDIDPIATYGTGPCAAEIETAAGVTPGGGVLVNGTAVSTACMDTAGSCGKASALGDCSAEKCATECGTTACMAP